MIPGFFRRSLFALAVLPLLVTYFKSRTEGYGLVSPMASASTKIEAHQTSGSDVGLPYPFRNHLHRDNLDPDAEEPLDVDRLDDRAVRDLLYHELGSGTEHILRMLFGDLEEDSPSISKRSDLNPKNKPRWKFIGLGKRRNFSPQLAGKPEKTLFPYQWNAPVENFDVTDPYLSALALTNLDEFFDTIKDEIGTTSESAETTKDPKNLKATAASRPKVNPGLRNSLNWWGGAPKTVYDPGWMLTGLGR